MNCGDTAPWACVSASSTRWLLDEASSDEAEHVEPRKALADLLRRLALLAEEFEHFAIIGHELRLLHVTERAAHSGKEGQARRRAS
jgi:hypothetical protein